MPHQVYDIAKELGVKSDPEGDWQEYVRWNEIREILMAKGCSIVLK